MVVLGAEWWKHQFYVKNTRPKKLKYVNTNSGWVSYSEGISTLASILTTPEFLKLSEYRPAFLVSVHTLFLNPCPVLCKSGIWCASI